MMPCLAALSAYAAEACGAKNAELDVVGDAHEDHDDGAESQGKVLIRRIAEGQQVHDPHGDDVDLRGVPMIAAMENMPNPNQVQSRKPTPTDGASVGSVTFRRVRR